MHYVISPLRANSATAPANVFMWLGSVALAVSGLWYAMNRRSNPSSLAMAAYTGDQGMWGTRTRTRTRNVQSLGLLQMRG